MLHKLVVKLSLMLFLPFLSFNQESYNQCIQAQELCPNVSINVNNIGANVTFCPGCEDDFTFCFSPENSIWLTFQTTSDDTADVDIVFSNIQFENGVNQGNQLQATILQAVAPCDATTFSQVGNCVSNAGGQFTLSAIDLPPNSTYYVVISGAQNNGATSPAEASMDVFLTGSAVNRIPPSMLLQTSGLTVCKDYKVQFFADTANCPENETYYWLKNGDTIGITTTNTFETAQLETGDFISVITSCYTLCPVVLNGQVGPFTVLTEPTVDAGPDKYILEGQSVQLNGSTNAPFYSWSPTFSISNSTVLNPYVMPNETTTYFLEATDNICTFSDQATVFVQKDLEITNTFTPNGDGSNDTWYIPGLELYPDCLVQIIDRWGQEVFQATGYDLTKSWNGTINGKPANEGVYFYSINLRTTQFPEPFRGTLTLIR